MKGLKNQLKQLISQPVFRHQMKTRYPTQMGKLTLPQLPVATADTALASMSRERPTTSVIRDRPTASVSRDRPTASVSRRGRPTATLQR